MLNDVNRFAGGANWLEDFRRVHGRAPRVLHVGNIANNAYNNAKLMRAAGVDCDVICYDYYHVMGCPEWEDADFEVSPTNQFYPDWTSVDLRGYDRPRWFAQGPVTLCIAYLAAMRRGDHERADLLWDALSLTNKTHSLGSLRRSLLGKLRLFAAVAYEKLERQYRVITSHPEPLARVISRLAPVRARFGSVTAAVATALCYPAVLLLRAVDAGVDLFRGTADLFQRRAAELIARFGAEFPERQDKLSLPDLLHYKRLLPVWRGLFSHYDFVQAYATDPILPLVSGKDFFAFEHGTLRDIPFQNTLEGRITVIAYRLAQHVFVTNHDCLGTARFLAGERVSFINHPYDEDQALGVPGWEREREAIERSTDSSFLFFFPTRQDWSGGKITAEKANDIFLRAFCELRRRGHRVGMVACEWGIDLDESKKLIEQLGCSQYVCWLPPMGIVRFSRFARACHVVADQFKLGAFGGVVFKALAVGAPVLTYLDEVAISKLYAEPPPVINCRSTEEIVERMERIIENPGALADVSGASRRWIKRYHSAAQTVETELAAYGRQHAQHSAGMK